MVSWFGCTLEINSQQNRYFWCKRDDFRNWIICVHFRTFCVDSRTSFKSDTIILMEFWKCAPGTFICVDWVISRWNSLAMDYTESLSGRWTRNKVFIYIFVFSWNTRINSFWTVFRTTWTLGCLLFLQVYNVNTVVIVTVIAFSWCLFWSCERTFCGNIRF